MTKRELDNAGASSLAQALEAEALAQSVNVAHRRPGRGAHRLRRTPHRRTSRAVVDRARSNGRCGACTTWSSATIPDRDMIVRGDERRTFGER